MSYCYNRGWYYCKECNTPFWHGNSYMFDICYDCLPKKDKKGWFFKFENGLYLKKLKEQNKRMTIESKIEAVEYWIIQRKYPNKSYAECQYILKTGKIHD